MTISDNIFNFIHITSTSIDDFAMVKKFIVLYKVLSNSYYTGYIDWIFGYFEDKGGPLYLMAWS